MCILLKKMLFFFSYEIVQFYNCTVCSDMFYNAVAAAYRCAQGQIGSATATPSSFLPNVKGNPTIVSCFALD
jgi:hypothetical protein